MQGSLFQLSPGTHIGVVEENSNMVLKTDMIVKSYLYWRRKYFFHFAFRIEKDLNKAVICEKIRSIFIIVYLYKADLKNANIINCETVLMRTFYIVEYLWIFPQEIYVTLAMIF